MPYWRHTYHHKVLLLSSRPLTIGECLYGYVRSKKKIVDRVQIFLMYFKNHALIAQASVWCLGSILGLVF